MVIRPEHLAYSIAQYIEEPRVTRKATPSSNPSTAIVIRGLN